MTLASIRAAAKAKGYKLMKNPKSGFKKHKGASLMAKFDIQMVHKKK